MSQYRIVKAESALDLVEYRLLALNVQQNVVCLMNLGDWVGQLTATPVLGAMHCTTGIGNHALIALYHGRNLFALVRMDQKHDFVMSHCIPLRIVATRLSGVARGCDLAAAPP